jgi:hypothetical protein
LDMTGGRARVQRMYVMPIKEGGRNGPADLRKSIPFVPHRPGRAGPTFYAQARTSVHRRAEKSTKTVHRVAWALGCHYWSI